MSDDEDKAPDPWWTPEREACFERVVAGWPKTQIADHLKRTRQTIINWCQHEKFVARIQEHNDDRLGTTKQRRVVETTLATDRVMRIGTKLLEKAEKQLLDEEKGIGKGMDGMTFDRALRALGSYQQLRNEERINSGENVQKFQHNVQGVVGHLHQHSVTQSSFKGFLTEAMKKKAIDVNTEIDGETGQDALLQLSEMAFGDSDVLDEIAKAEKENLIIDAHSMSERR
jgi:hypothetical protein